MAPHVKSKRQTLRHKYKVEKKVREHRRKVRKAIKGKVAGPARKNKRKDPGIPNLWPFKQELMEELERKRQEAKLAKEARREFANDEERRAAEMEALSADAARKEKAFEENQPDDNSEGSRATGTDDGSRKAFMKEFRRVVESSDVLLEVLDARDPVGCRCVEAERAVMAASGGTKRIVLVLNKVDLVPKHVTEKWLAYLRNDLPTVAFRASVQGGSSAGRRVGQANVSALAASSLGTADCLGASSLMSLLKNYARSKDIKTSVTVGVIGFPNVGKSSLINSLKRSRVVSTGATPGLTRTAQEVHLDKNVRLIDCPGIVFSDQAADALVLRNCIRIEQLADPLLPVEMILRRVGPEPLMAAYSLPAFDDITEFLALIAQARSKHKRGGSLDLEAAARIVLQDWNGGDIPFYTLPPTGPRSAHISAEVVQQWSNEFCIDGKAKEEETALLDKAVAAGPHDETDQVCVDECSSDDSDDEDGRMDLGETAGSSANARPGTPQDELSDRPSGDANGSAPSYHVSSEPSRRHSKRLEASMKD